MKKPPQNVTIGGIKFQIVVSAIENGDYGRMNFDERKIILNTTCLVKASLMHETLRHEMLHAALHISGVSFSERYDEENIVRAIEHIFVPAWEKMHQKLTSI